ncbi:hypothetical protein H2200_005113 [Cladophialophora chaetospira]|uniref:Heterokaryon incompatibility domain-containing protein n=1 Tax=Cladophialophora chaetospira TaxID=386627 RepID=A0AA39CJI0_9EURO|nr:hypothetical protein H2200_005113 [Cladophialophora chaetospira]
MGDHYARSGTSAALTEEFPTLCEDCATIDFGDISLPTDLDAYIVLGNDPSCSLCRFVRGGAFGAEVSSDKLILVISSAEVSGLQGLDLASVTSAVYLRAYSIPKHSARLWMGSYKPEWAMSTIFCVNELTGPTRPHPYAQKYLSTPTVDFDRVSKWVQRCEESHERCYWPIHSGPSSTDPLGFMLLNIETNEVVPADYSWKYAALSYVWGDEEPSCQSREQSQGRTDHLAPTIHEAVVAARALKLRYLWVDYLCIPIGEAFQRQIRNMHQVYTSAFITLVATSSKSAQDGLLCVTKNHPRKSSQRQLVLNNYELVACQNVADPDAFVRCTWNTRAWTLQETLLSRRCLCFSSDGVSLWCKTRSYFESLVDDPKDSPDIWPDLASPMLSSYYLDWIWGDYYRLVLEYTSRNLSFDSDALNAFAGIEAQLESSSGSRFHYGHPTESMECLLGWTAHTPGMRDIPKHVFPSWSWAKQRGIISFRSHNISESSRDADTYWPRCQIIHVPTFEDADFKTVTIDATLVKCTLTNSGDRRGGLHGRGVLRSAQREITRIWWDDLAEVPDAKDPTDFEMGLILLHLLEYRVDRTNPRLDGPDDCLGPPLSLLALVVSFNDGLAYRRGLAEWDTESGDPEYRRLEKVVADTYPRSLQLLYAAWRSEGARHIIKLA